MSLTHPSRMLSDVMHHPEATAQYTQHQVAQHLHDIANDPFGSIIETNPDAEQLAHASDIRWQQGHALSALDGVPIAIKDNIDTGDRMQTTAGSAALLSSRVLEDAWVIKKLRQAGLIPIAKANLSEWANFRANRSSSGYSTRGGQCFNPHDLTRSPSGSSSGSAAAVASGLVAVALGSETDGSIISPSSRCGVVGIKPTVGLVSRTGVIPISASQDTVGTHANSVADAASILQIIAGYDRQDPATQQIPAQVLQQLRQPMRPLSEFRIGIARQHFTGYHRLVDTVFAERIRQLREHGVQLVDDVVINHVPAVRSRDDEYTVMLYEFKQGLNTYLKRRVPLPGLEHHAPQSLSDIIRYNAEHPNPEFYFDQGILELADQMQPSDRQRYQQARRWCKRHAGELGIDAALANYQVDAIIVPSGAPAWKIDHINGDAYAGNGDSTGMAACAGYPLITIPMGQVQHLPIGMTIMGTAWSEAQLISIAHGLELIFREGV